VGSSAAELAVATVAAAVQHMLHRRLSPSADGLALRASAAAVLAAAFAGAADAPVLPGADAPLAACLHAFDTHAASSAAAASPACRCG
jgi:hypothetical protein